jgi:hypothetical protein
MPAEVPVIRAKGDVWHREDEHGCSYVEAVKLRPVLEKKVLHPDDVEELHERCTDCTWPD